MRQPRQELGEPGVIEAVAAAPVGEHDERMLITVGCFGILVKIELGEERQHKRRCGALADRGGIEQPQRQMAAAFVRVGVVELPDPDRKGGAALRALRERCSGRSRQQRAGKYRTARGSKFPYEARQIVIAHAPVLSSTQRECKAARVALDLPPTLAEGASHGATHLDCCYCAISRKGRGRERRCRTLVLV